MSLVITEFGARGDGATLNTAAIQRAIDTACAEGGCGHVVVPRGIFLTGTLHLRSGLRLDLRAGAVLKGSPRIADYEEAGAGFQKDLQPYHLLAAHGAADILVTGPGTIDGSGPAFWEPAPLPSGWFRELPSRPSPLIELRDCERVVWEGVTIANSPGWTLHLKRCADVVLRGLAIRNNLHGPNTDGLDIDGCRDVRVSDCLIEAGDDAIVLKTTPDSRPCERVTVTNCVIATNCRALKLGALESFHDMRDVVFSNCVVRQSVAVFAVYSRQSATLENIAAANIVGHAFSNPDFNQPIHIDLAGGGRIRNVSVSNFLCHTNGRILITGEPGNPVENIALHGVQMHLREPFDPYPSGLAAKGRQFSPPAPLARAARAAIAVQHARNLDIRASRIHWPEKMPAPFHAFAGWDVRGGTLDRAGLAASDASVPALRLEESSLDHEPPAPAGG